MADDVRIATSLRTHRKTKRLRRKLGAEGCWALVCLFLWAGEERWTGDLAGLSDEDIEEEADWSGEPGALVAALLEVRFLIGEPGSRAINDWQEHNPYAATKGERIEKGRKAAEARWGKKNNATSKKINARGIPRACGEDATHQIEQCPPAPTLPDQEPTEPNGSDAGASPDELPADPIWGTGLAFLVRKGIPEKPARALLGKVKQACGDIEAGALLADAEAQDITDPAPWLMAAASNRRARAGPNGQKPIGKQAQGLMALEAMKSGNRMAAGRTADGVPEALLLGVGTHPGG